MLPSAGDREVKIYGGEGRGLQEEVKEKAGLGEGRIERPAGMGRVEWGRADERV